MSTAPMTDEEMQQFMKQIHVLEEEMKSSGAWIFGGVLHGPDTATVVRVSEGDVLTNRRSPSRSRRNTSAAST